MAYSDPIKFEDITECKKMIENKPKIKYYY